MSDGISVSSRSMKKWGIPETYKVSNEQTLLERLVWVKNQGHWWPALLYKSYAELQSQIYDQLDMSIKAQFAVAIMKELQSKNKVRLARLLGRDMLEVVEVKDGQYAEFYWQLSNVLPDACNRSHYGNNIELYIDFHRALDQVEEIIQEVSQNKVNLLPSNDHKTWEQRARETLEANLSTSEPKMKRADDEDMLGGFDSFMATLSKSVDDMIGIEQPKDKGEIIVTPPSARPSSSQHHLPRESFDATDRYATAHSQPQQVEFNQRFPSEGFDSSTRAVFDEARDPSNEYYRRRSSTTVGQRPNYSRGGGSKSGGSKGVSSSRQQAKQVQLLPGLEAEDIIPGITETNLWKNVLEHMLVSKTGSPEEIEEVSVALERSAKRQMRQKELPSRAPIANHGFYAPVGPTFPKADAEPQYKRMSVVSTSTNNRPPATPSIDPGRFQYQSTPTYTGLAETRAQANPVVRSDPDTILAEEPKSRDLGLSLTSDDTLWGFLTCRATDM